MDQTSEPTTTTTDRSRAWITGPLIVLFLYVFSLGPVSLIAEKTKVNPAVLRQIYAPVIWLHDHTVLKKPLEAYVRLWGVH